MKIVAFGVLLLLAMRASGQEHAPTIEQCRADAAGWEASLDANIPMAELVKRSEEMNNCVMVAVELHKGKAAPDQICVEAFRQLLDSRQIELKFSGLAMRYRNEFEHRVATFLTRHNLMEQLYSEDASGKR